MEIPSEPASTPLLDRTSRRWTAILLSMVTPGLGHLVIGYPRRMVAWCSSLFLVIACAVVGAMQGAPITMAICYAIARAMRLGAAIDTVRLVRPPHLPRPRAVALILIGFVAFVEIMGGRVRSRLIEAFKLPSGSMYPTLEIGDHIFATKLDRKFGRGEVVVFHFPLDPKTDYLKRIVAVEGDRFEIRGGTLIVNDQPVPRAPSSRSCRRLGLAIRAALDRRNDTVIDA